MRKVSSFTFYFTYFAAIAFMMPFVVLFFQSLGFSGTEIGILTGVGPLITLFCAPFWTGLADSTHRHKLIMSIMMLAAIAALIVYPTLKTFIAIIVITVIYNIFIAPTSSLADSATMHMLENEKDMYGRLRLGGTIGFGLIAPLAGILVQNYGLKMAFWGAAVFYFLAYLCSQSFLFHASENRTSFIKGLRALLLDSRWIYFLIIAFAGGISVAVTNNYLFVYLKELGATETTMGIALTIGTICEAPVLYFAPRLMSKFKAYRLLILSMVITGIRLLLFAISRTPNDLLLLQLLNGFTFPVTWIAGVMYADENAPAGLSSTAQGLFSAASFGLGMSTGGFFGGMLVENIGGSGMYFASGIIILVMIGIVALLGTKRLAASHQVLESA